MPNDKIIHFLGGAVICLAVSLFFGGLIGLTVAIVAGIIKEAYDMTGKGTPELMDAIATIAGGLVGFLLIMIERML